MVYAALGFVKFHGVVWGEILNRKLEAETCGARLAVERAVSFHATANTSATDGQCCVRFASDPVAIRLWVLAHGIGIWAGLIRAGSGGCGFCARAAENSAERSCDLGILQRHEIS